MAGKFLTSAPVPFEHTTHKSSSHSAEARLHPSDHGKHQAREGSERSQRNGRAFSYPEQRRSPTSSQTDLPRFSHAASNTAISARPSRNMHYVFVYGTLKRGFPNSHLLERATFIGEFRTVTKYPLVVGGQYFSPYLLDIPQTGNRVKGEMYVVNDAILADLDHLERVGINYTRKVEKVASCNDRSFVADAFIYFKCNDINTLAKNAFLEDYQCRRYIPQDMRN